MSTAAPHGNPGDHYWAVNVWHPMIGRNVVHTVQQDNEEDAREAVQRTLDRSKGEKVEWVSQLTYDDPSQADALADMFNAGYEIGYRDCTEGGAR